MLLLSLRFLHVRAHANEGVGDFGDFITAAAFERVAEIARLQGEVAALREQHAATEIAEEHHRAELAAAHLEVAEARAAQLADQARLEELRRTLGDLRSRLEQAEETRTRAENERAAVIAALGRKARRSLGSA